MTRTILTIVFLTLFSQTTFANAPDWQPSIKISCENVKFYADEAFFNIELNRKDIWDLNQKIMETQKGIATAEQNEIKETWENLKSESIEILEKWAAMYRTFCK